MKRGWIFVTFVVFARKKTRRPHKIRIQSTQDGDRTQVSQRQVQGSAYECTNGDILCFTVVNGDFVCDGSQKIQICSASTQIGCSMSGIIGCESCIYNAKRFCRADEDSSISSSSQSQHVAGKIFSEGSWQVNQQKMVSSSVC